MQNTPQPQVRMRAQSVGGRVYTAQTGSDQVKVYQSHADANNDTNGTNVTATLQQAQSRTAQSEGSGSSDKLHQQAAQWDPNKSKVPKNMPLHTPTSCVEARLQMGIAANNITNPSQATTQFSNNIFEQNKKKRSDFRKRGQNEPKLLYNDRIDRQLQNANENVRRKANVSAAWQNSEQSMYGAAIENGNVKKRCGWCEQRGFSTDGQLNRGRHYNLGNN